LKTPTPEAERYADRHPGPGECREEQKIGGEEHIYERDQAQPAEPLREPAVAVDDAEEEHRLPGRSVRLHLRAAVQQDERLARGLEQVVRG
jgi:hypothetical protein